jgi:hypothetical protein
MAIDTTKISLGVCDVTYNAVDLGATKGGVEVEIKTETYEVKVDQTGETVAKEIIIGTMVTVKVPMAETDLTRIAMVMPQSVSYAASGSLPTGRTAAVATVGATTFTQTGAGGGTIQVGMQCSFQNHAVRYIVTSVNTNIIGIRPVFGGVGLQAALTASEPVTFYATTGGVEIRPGVNTDLLSFAYELKLHPTGVAGGVTKDDFVVHKAAPSPNFTFKYETNGERIYEVTFKGYPDNANNYRVATFGQPQP